MERRVAVAKGPGFFWIFPLVLLCLGIIVQKALSPVEIGDLAVVFGEFLVYTAVLWGLFTLAFMREHTAGPRTLAFLALLGSMLMGVFGFGNTVDFDADADEILRTMQDDLAATLEEERAEAGVTPETPRANRPGRPAPRASGEVPPIRAAFKTYLDELTVLRTSYESELEAIGWFEVLVAERLASDEGMRDGRRMITDARRIIGKYEDEYHELLTETISRVSELPARNSKERSLVEGLQQGLESSRSNMVIQWNLERDIVDRVESMLTLLENSEGWEVEDSQVAFYSKWDLRKYNVLWSEINNIVSHQEQLQQRSLQQAGLTMD